MEDQTVEATVDNEGMVADYFQEYEEVDDPSVAASADKPSEGKPEQASAAPAAAPTQKADTTAQPQQQQNGFMSRFYKADDKGQSVFDAEAAHGFLFNKDMPRFAYQGNHAGKQQQQPQQQQTPQEEVEPWRKPLVERRNYEEEQAKHILYAVNKMREQLPQADPGTKAFLDMQERYARDYIREEMLPKWEYERSIERERQRHEELERKEKAATYKQTAGINQSELASKMGGDDAFNQFFFGQTITGADGKQQFVKGPATDTIYHLFDLFNRDKQSLVGEELSQAMADWWNEFSSSKPNLMFVYQAGLAELQRQAWPQLVGKIGAVKEEELLGKRKAATPAPSAVSHVSKESGKQGGTGFAELDRYLYGPESI